MPVLTAAVVLIGVTCLMNLLLTYGVIRRLRRHSLLLSGPDAAGAPVAAAGSVLGDFAATATDGTPVARSAFTEPTLVGFFSPGCRPCEELIPRFEAVVQGRAAVQEGVEVRRFLAVVSSGAREEAYIARLAALVPVVSGPEAAKVEKAFDVRGFPAVCVVGAGGVIMASGVQLLPQPVHV